MNNRVMSVPAGVGDSNLTLFPNGYRHQLASQTDVWLGAGFLDYIEFSVERTATLTGTVNVYDGLTNSTGRPVVGGTTTTDRWRLIASAATVQATQQGDPYTLVAPNAEVTNLRKVLDTIRLERGTAVPHDNVFRIDVGHEFCGMAIHIAWTVGAIFTVHLGFLPRASGASRRRQFYHPGSTTKIQPVEAGSIPL